MGLFERAGHAAETGASGANPVARPAAAGSTSADRRRWWRANCRDVANTHRFLTVLLNRDKVVLVGPPGRTVALTTGGVGELSAALRKAAEQARK